MKQWPYNKMVECNELVLKSQLLNQLSCVSVTETGTLGRRVNCSIRDADGQLPAEPRRNAKDRRRNGNKRGLFDQKSFEGNPYRPVGHAAAKMINDGPDS